MILPLDSFKPLSPGCLQCVTGTLVLYGRNEVILISLLEGGECSRVRIRPDMQVLRGHYYQDRLAVITRDLRLHVYKPRSDADKWLPWTHQQMPVEGVRSCFWLDEDMLMLGFDDGAIKRISISTGMVEEVCKSSAGPITLVSKHIYGTAAGHLYSIKEQQPIYTALLLHPTLLCNNYNFNSNDVCMISIYDTALCFNGTELERSVKTNCEIVGASLSPFQACLKNGTILHGPGEDNIIDDSTLVTTAGFACGDQFAAHVQEKSPRGSWELNVKGHFPTTPIPNSVLYEAAKIVSLSKVPMTMEALSTQLTNLFGNIAEQLSDIFSVDKDGHISATRELEEYFITGNRSLHLTDTAYRALKIIAASGRDGVVQGDLCKQLDIDHKTIFHHLKPLIRSELILRYPVTYNRTFTYILLHWSYSTSTSDDEVSNQKGVGVSLGTAKQVLLRLLQEAPNRTMPGNELFGGAQLDNRKVFEKAISALACQGLIECFRGSELGQRDSIIRIKEEKLTVPSASAVSVASVASVASVEDSSAEEEQEEEEELFATTNHILGLPLGFQIYQLIHQSGSQGITSKTICEHFGVTSKASHRMLARIIGKPPFCQDVTKQAEFSGRQRRFRFFDSTTVQDEDDGYDEATPISLPNSTIASGVASTTSSSRGESVTKTLRINTLMQLLKEQQDGLLEVSKPLAVRMTELAKSEHVLDVKTLKRTATVMEEAGMVKLMTISVHHISKLLMALPDTPTSKIDEYVERLKKSIRPSTHVVEQVIVDSEIEVDKYAHGFVFGSMARAQLLHEYLLSKAHTESDHYKVDSVTAIFKDLPLSLYAKLIGFERVDEQIHEALNAQVEQPIAGFKVNVRKLRGVVEKLLELLVEEGVLSGPLNMNIPHYLCLPMTVSVPVSMSMSVHSSNDLNTFKLPEDVTAFWKNARNNSVYPERWLQRPLTAKERREQRKQRILVEDLENIVGLADETPLPQSPAVRVYSDEEDRALFIACTIAFHQRERYTRMFASAGKLPFRLLLSLSTTTTPLSAHSTGQDNSVIGSTQELRRRVKNFASNMHDRQQLARTDQDVCFVERAAEAGLIQIPFDMALTAYLLSSEEGQVEANVESNVESVMINEFKALFDFFSQHLYNIADLKERVNEHHRNLQSIDITRLKPVIPRDHVHLLSELEAENRTRTEVIDEYYSLPVHSRQVIHPTGFPQLRTQLLQATISDADDVTHLQAHQDVVQYALQCGLIVKAGRKKARLFINADTFHVNADALMLPAQYTVPESIEDLQQESPEGLLAMLAIGDISIDPDTLQVHRPHHPQNDPQQVLKYSYLCGRWSILSSDERSHFLSSLTVPI